MEKVKCNFKNPSCSIEIGSFLKNCLKDNTIIVCIGTDRCIGDCLGPLVGTLLKDSNFPIPVFGTISEPIHAVNLEKKINEIKSLYPTSSIIGIDACLGDSDNIGEIQARLSPIHPGKGVGKVLPSVGEFSIIGIVDSSANSEFFSTRTIRLSLIMDMAKSIVNSIWYAYDIYKS